MKADGCGRQEITKADVHEIIAYLKGKGWQLAGLLAHDSCDRTLTTLREAFSPCYREVPVEEKITVAYRKLGKKGSGPKTRDRPSRTHTFIPLVAGGDCPVAEQGSG